MTFSSGRSPQHTPDLEEASHVTHRAVPVPGSGSSIAPTLGRLAAPAQRRAFTWRAMLYGMATMYDTVVDSERHRITPDLAAPITTPLAIADPDDEQCFPGRPQRLYDMAPGAERTAHLARSERADGHCHPMVRSRASERFSDFFDVGAVPA